MKTDYFRKEELKSKEYEDKFQKMCEEALKTKEFNDEFEKTCIETEKGTKKPNILLCGGTGIGKSSMINSLLEFAPGEGPKIGREGRPETRGIKLYTTAASTVNLYDSEGYELAEDGDENFIDEIMDMVDDKTGDDRIELVWYCISAANKRIHETDKKIIDALKSRDIPVLIILTKVDLVDEEELTQLKNTIKNNFPDESCYTYFCKDEAELYDSTDEEIVKEYVQIDKIYNWTFEKLEQMNDGDKLLTGFVKSAKDSNKVFEYVWKKIIMKNIVEASGVVVGIAITHIPLADAVALMGIQTKMGMEIFDAYDVPRSWKSLGTSVLQTTVISQLGKMIAGNLVGLIPGVGTVLKATVNTTVAGSVTALMGLTMSLLCFAYKKSNAKNPNNFFTKEIFSETLDYVKKSGLIDQLMNSINNLIDKNSGNKTNKGLVGKFKAFIGQKKKSDSGNDLMKNLQDLAAGFIKKK